MPDISALNWSLKSYHYVFIQLHELDINNIRPERNNCVYGYLTDSIFVTDHKVSNGKIQSQEIFGWIACLAKNKEKKLFPTYLPFFWSSNHEHDIFSLNMSTFLETDHWSISSLSLIVLLRLAIPLIEHYFKDFCVLNNFLDEGSSRAIAYLNMPYWSNCTDPNSIMFP